MSRGTVIISKACFLQTFVSPGGGLPYLKCRSGDVCQKYLKMIDSDNVQECPSLCIDQQIILPQSRKRLHMNNLLCWLS